VNALSDGQLFLKGFDLPILLIELVPEVSNLPSIIDLIVVLIVVRVTKAGKTAFLLRASRGFDNALGLLVVNLAPRDTSGLFQNVTGDG